MAVIGGLVMHVGDACGSANGMGRADVRWLRLRMQWRRVCERGWGVRWLRDGWDVDVCCGVGEWRQWMWCCMCGQHDRAERWDRTGWGCWYGGAGGRQPHIVPFGVVGRLDVFHVDSARKRAGEELLNDVVVRVLFLQDSCSDPVTVELGKWLLTDALDADHDSLADFVVRHV